ncbi:hypothetical protein D5038_08120 [Verminephrobacter aporrectodeae subsp. tuberculatae]|uniref:carboxyl transferase n=1 Tax=Verminephrobacter aporrectodeae TaxID=1110389 RepID=UPI0002378201|nr:carboxyl transferase [Verminephrobacter aporrectodeae]MCW5256315.1 hypothetical protein [Verminephrobacter aporrectodeae subsp. tuberculatae]
MFDKILIANRGEIACKRICRSPVMLRDQRLENPWRKHGNIPLQGKGARMQVGKFSKGSP